jgi:hypothetical protein
MASLVMEFPEFVRFGRKKEDVREECEMKLEEMTLGELLYFALFEGAGE